jgi:hypothetical protein
VARIEKAYAQIVDRIRERKAMQVQQQADEENRKKDEESNILKHKPEVLLHDLIDERVSAKVHEISGDADMNPVERKKAEGKLSSFVQSLQEKRLVPGGGLGVCIKRQSKCEGEITVKKEKQEQRHMKRKGKSTQQEHWHSREEGWFDPSLFSQSWHGERGHFQFFSQSGASTSVQSTSSATTELESALGPSRLGSTWTGRKAQRQRTWRSWR